MFRIFRLVTIGLLGLTACASPPVTEVRAFANAIDAFNAAGQPLLDELAVAERVRDRNLAVMQAPPRDVIELPAAAGEEPRRVLVGLPAGTAPLFASSGDPPATQGYRKGVAALKHYAAVLVLLAEGQNIEAARAELGMAATSVAGLAAVVTGGAALPLAGIVAALGPILDDAARAKNDAELRRLVIEASPKVRELNAALRAGADPMLRTLVGPQRRILTSEVPPAVIEGAIARIDGYRAAVADWLALLDVVDKATDELVAIVSAPPTNASIASLGQLAAQATSHAEAARRALAVARAGP